MKRDIPAAPHFRGSNELNFKPWNLNDNEYLIYKYFSLSVLMIQFATIEVIFIYLIN